jgi:hypothetical protein
MAWDLDAVLYVILVLLSHGLPVHMAVILTVAVNQDVQHGTVLVDSQQFVAA